MELLLANKYDIIAEEQISIAGNIAYKKDEWLYLTTLARNKEAILMEQAVLAYYLAEKNHVEVAYPIQNNEGHWISSWQGEQRIVYKKKDQINQLVKKEGEGLASFHQSNRDYQYEPEQISSFGRWKSLWIQKLTTFENYLSEVGANDASNYYRLMMDVLPYLIGISENAIQYMEETEGESRYSEGDQGTITFHRYEAQIKDQLILPDMLMYDHAARDIAEYIRPLLLSHKEEKVNEAIQFINDYTSVEALSLFGFRLVYARLLFPLHIFDLIGDLMDCEDKTEQYMRFSEMIQKQNDYERNLKTLFEGVGQDNNFFDLPMVQWL